MANANFTCVLDAWRDGRTLYGRMHYYRSGSYYYYDTSFPDPTMNLGGTVFTDTDFGNRVRSGIYVGDVYSTTFSRTVAGSGDRTVTWSAGSGIRSDFAGSWSATVWFPEQYTDPSGLSVSVAERYTDGFKFNVSLNSYGNPSDASGRYIEAAILGQSTYGGTYRFQIASNTNSASITVNNSSRTGSTPLTINPNTMYYIGAYATNTQRSISIVSGQYTTLALAPTFPFVSVTDETATITYATQADGGKYAKDIQYSLDNGVTWITGATVTGGAATTGSFTISGLTPGTAYTVQTRVNTTAGNTNGTSVSFATEVERAPMGLYGPVNSQATRVSDFYGSVNGEAELANKVYGSVNGRTKLIHQGFGHFPYYGQVVYYTDAGHTDTGVILLKNQSQIDQLHGSWQGWETEIEGVQLNSADIKEVYIEKQAESIPQGFLIACSSIDTVDLSESEITSIPANFLSYCSNFNGTLKLPPATQTIGSRFLYEAKHFNQPLTIPTGVTSINYNFLYNASDFNQPITLPPSLVSLGYQFLYGCNKMTSTVNVGSLSADIATYNDRTLATNSSSAAMYRTGVTIAGANRAAWLAKFPNSNSVPFRKLVDAGY